MDSIAALEPRSIWEIFAEISRIPRDSGKEAAVMKMLAGRAAGRGFGCEFDRTGNLLVSVPATSGKEGLPGIVLQGHADMVCEKNRGTVHDFSKDPIRLRVDGEWVRAEGTTLGADNGIGVAMALAAAEDPTVSHGPLEILVTVDEERGLTGAAGLPAGFFKSLRMINLDSEEEDAICIGCAGGRDSVFAIRGRRGPAPEGSIFRRVSILGLTGGHSGLDIHRSRGNAIMVLARLLVAASAGGGMHLVSIEGGSKRNAIPREAVATVVIPETAGAGFEAGAKEAAARIASEELAGIDDGLEIRVDRTDGSVCFAEDFSHRALQLLLSIPSGVTAMSQEIDGLVESSSNLGVVTTEKGTIRIVCASRSSVGLSLEALAVRHRALASLANAKIEQPRGYPGWKPNLASGMLRSTQRAYLEVFGHEPKLKAVHAGLECGLFTEKVPSLDIVSFGPDIVGAHSPDERVSIPSVGRIWELLKATLGA